MTISAPIDRGSQARGINVYSPQQDSHLLVDTMQTSIEVAERTVLDLCTGSGVVAIAAARAGARSVTAWDVSPDAVRCSTANASAAGVNVDVRRGSWTGARGRYDVVLANPPYVPADPDSAESDDGPTWAWDAGPDGRLVVGPLCEAAEGLLAPGGTLLMVQSEFTGIDQSLTALECAGLGARVVARRRIPFGPVLTARAGWLERTARLAPGRREEEIVVIRADKP